MTIRERTREIGTIRAVGMQKEDVRNMFVLETLFLTLFSAVLGTIAGFGVMGFLSRFTFHLSDNPFGMLLVNGHVYFLPTLTGIAGNVLLIVAIAVVTAYFPARRAAELSPAKALGHFE
jgi:putative ABC transport system permease protein